MLALEDLFPHLSGFRHRHLVEEPENPWEAVRNLEPGLRYILNTCEHSARRMDSIAEATVTEDGCGSDPGLFITQWMQLDEAVVFPKLGIAIGKGTKLEPSAIIKGPCVIGENCDVRQGAYLRGNVLTGNHCTLGHATEIKNSILMNHTEAGHFNYIGDSVLGSYVNMGAGSKLANLQFRTSEEKLNGFIHNIRLPAEEGEVDTGTPKLGSVLGDHVELGCNAVLSPGSVLGAHVWVYPNLTVPKGFYAPRQVLLPRVIKPRSKNR